MAARYDAFDDPYCYPGSCVLKNLPGLTSQQALDRFETVATGRRFLEPMPTGRWSVSHYRSIHRHIFQDVYAWAGRERTVRVSKGGNTFCYPENIDTELRRIFHGLKNDRWYRGLDIDSYIRQAAHLLAELNAVHPFRDGNGRTQLAFLTLLSKQAGHPLDLGKLDPVAFLQSVIRSFHGFEEPLAGQLAVLIDAKS